MDLILLFRRRIPADANEPLDAAVGMRPLKRGTLGSMLEQLRDPRVEA